jgi:catechol 2,3-dioxygenase-like lactoylglutathione lyase family enzyme
MFLTVMDMIVGIDHFEIIVEDLDKSIEYYLKLGFEMVKRTEEERTVEIKAGNIAIDVIEANEERNETGLHHVAFLVDDVDQTVSDWKKKGIEISLEPMTSERSGRRLSAIKDIDGIMHQLAKPI